MVLSHRPGPQLSVTADAEPLLVEAFAAWQFERQQAKEKAEEIPDIRTLESFIRYVFGLDLTWFQREWIREIFDPPVPRRAIIVAPPESGKSTIMAAFLAWRIGQNPNIHIGYLSGSADQAKVVTNLVRDIIRHSAEFQYLFPNVVLDDSRGTAEDEWFVKRGGRPDKDATVIATGYRGKILGRRVDLLVVDDYSNDENTHTAYQAEQAWGWFNKNAFSRLNADTGELYCIQNRWSEEDIVAHLRDELAGVEYRIYQAMWEETDARGNTVEVVLWPEKWSLKGMQELRQSVGFVIFDLTWNGIVRPAGSRLFERAWFTANIVDDYPADLKIVRRWDLAATKNVTSDYTAGAKVGEKSGQIWIIDIQYDRGRPLEVERMILGTAMMDGVEIPIRIEQEGGASGIFTVDHFQREVLKKWDCKGISTRVEKMARIGVLASKAQAGNVKMVRGAWNQRFINEIEAITGSGREHDDQADAVSGAIQDLDNLKPKGARLLPIRRF